MSLTGQPNRISATLSEADIAEIMGYIAKINEKLSFAVGLTPEEKQRLPKIQVDNKQFVEDAIEVSAMNAAVLPNYISVAEVDKDYQLFLATERILTPLTQLVEKVTDVQTLAGSEAYTASLMLYKMYQMAAAMGLPGMDAVVDKLKKRFAGQGSASDKSE